MECTSFEQPFGIQGRKSKRVFETPGRPVFREFPRKPGMAGMMEELPFWCGTSRLASEVPRTPAAQVLPRGVERD
jgi:hypothetical protein